MQIPITVSNQLIIRLFGNKTYERSISATAGSVIELWIFAIKPRPGEKTSSLFLVDLEEGAAGISMVTFEK